MDTIQTKISKILPSMQSDTRDSLIKLLDDLGVSDEEELKYVEESDLLSVLRPIQARKLIDAWKQDTVPAVTQPVISTTTAAIPSSTPEINLPGTSGTVKNVPIDWVENFPIPWENMSEELIKVLKEGKRPSPANRKEFINVTSQSIFNVCSKPGKKNLTKIAQKAIATYPKAFSDIWCDEVVAGGYESLTRSFVVKFDNMNRRNSFNLVRRNLKRAKHDDATDDSMQLKASSNYGCLNWQPSILPIGESTETQLAKQYEMVQLSTSMKPEELTEQSLTLLEATFYSQRKDINNLKTVSSLLTSWPLLFTEKGFFLHFKILTTLNIPELIKNSSKTKFPRIITYFKSLPTKKKNMEDIFQQAESDVELKVVLSLLLEHFNEKKETIFISVDSSVTAKNIESSVTLPNTPCLICSGDDFVSTTYMVAVDQKVINEEVKSFDSGIMMVFAAYYVLNIEYAETASATLEFIQRCFLQINPEKGSKATKKRSAINTKVLTLLNKLMDYEWC